MKRLALVSAALLGLLIPSAVSAMAPHAPVTKFRHATFGPVLVTTKKQALYYWNVEKRAGGKTLKHFEVKIVRGDGTVPAAVGKAGGGADKPPF